MGMRYDVLENKWEGYSLDEKELRLHRCCFTGHRPEKLVVPIGKVITGLQQEIEKAIEDGFSTFITGMARGVDIWAGEIVLELRDKGRPIRLICASPYHGFEEGWSDEWKQRYRSVMTKSDLVRFICPGYSSGCFQRRNEWMVDHAARVIAVFNGQQSGTKNTIDYAEQRCVPVHMVKG